MPNQLRALGYTVEMIGTTERILPHEISERLLTEGSTVEQVRHHAGLVTVELYELAGDRKVLCVIAFNLTLTHH